MSSWFSLLRSCLKAIAPWNNRKIPAQTPNISSLLSASGATFTIWHSQKAVRRQKGIPGTDLDPEDWDSTSRGLAGGDMIDLQRAVDTRPVSKAKSVVMDETW
ncbi:uncharacterized protein RSE6_08820 [Rhynchosporium secalis]|uniref:Uncharacterized protein n=1 Tax=Rhynchosporium secalis TaxID=38038 RepID=A0A1E1MGE5_RHYSE|nr:uncharacterized protein RSE6_08820 [Rhynchosporium secalis]